MTLLELLSGVCDPRSSYGRRHQLSDVLLMCMMGIMSGYYGYRELGRFMSRHGRELQQTFRLLHKVPSHVTIRSILQQIDFAGFNDRFNQWASQYARMCSRDTIAIDGKAIASTISDYDKSYQNFVSLVCMFAAQRGIVLHCSRIENLKESEIPTVQQLVCALDVKGEVFTMDALHCQKKRHLP
jgi:hypothetical protein